MPELPSDHSPGLLRSIGRSYGSELGLVAAIVAVVLIASALDDSYYTKPVYNATEILRQSALLGIFALGAGIIIITGGIDLSSGSMIAFSGAVCTSIMLALVPVDADGNPVTRDVDVWVLLTAIAGTLLVAFLIGSFHAWLITVVRLPPFIATLASLVGLRSLARVMVQDVNGFLTPQGRNTQIYINDATFKMLGQTWWIPLLVFAALALLLWILMSRTVVGRHLYAIGGNEEAARLSGIRTDRLKWLAYCIGTLTAAVAGILYSSNIGMSNPTTQGLGYELNAIAAAVVGGCSLAGGVGTVPGIVLGAIFLRLVIDSVAKTVKTNPDDFQGLIVGILVVLAVTFNELRSSQGFRKQFFPGGLGIVNIFVLSLLAGVITAVMSSTNKLAYGGGTALVVLVLLVVKKVFEVRSRDKE